MEIISHRGYWKTPDEKNKTVAFKRSFSLGFGTETDIRDFDGELVISHDIANQECISFDDFLNIYKMETGNNRCTLALNIKADGLQYKAKEILDKYKVDNYFF